MARIPSAANDIRRRLPRGGSGVVSTADASAGVGVQQLGAQVGAIGNYLEGIQKDKTQKIERAWASRAISDADAYWAEESIKRQKEAPREPTNYARTMADDYRKYAERVSANAPEDVRQLVQERLLSMGMSIHRSALTFENARFGATAKDDISDSLNTNSSMVLLDPAKYEDALANHARMIAATKGVTGDVAAAEAMQAGEEALSQARAVSLLENGAAPSDVIDMMRDGQIKLTAKGTAAVLALAERKQAVADDAAIRRAISDGDYDAADAMVSASDTLTPAGRQNHENKIRIGRGDAAYSRAIKQIGSPMLEVDAEVADAFLVASATYDLDPELFQTIMQIESAGGKSTGSPRDADGNVLSTAGGYFQWLDSTAKQYGVTKGDILSETVGLARFTQDNRKALTAALGRDPTNEELWLAHNQGAAGAGKLLNAREETLAKSAVSARALTNNGVSKDELATLTAKEFVERNNDLYERRRKEALSKSGGADPDAKYMSQAQINKLAKEKQDHDEAVAMQGRIADIASGKKPFESRSKIDVKALDIMQQGMWAGLPEDATLADKLEVSTGIAITVHRTPEAAVKLMRDTLELGANPDDMMAAIDAAHAMAQEDIGLPARMGKSYDLALTVNRLIGQGAVQREALELGRSLHTPANAERAAEVTEYLDGKNDDKVRNIDAMVEAVMEGVGLQPGTNAYMGARQSVEDSLRARVARSTGGEMEISRAVENAKENTIDLMKPLYGKTGVSGQGVMKYPPEKSAFALLGGRLPPEQVIAWMQEDLVAGAFPYVDIYAKIKQEDAKGNVIKVRDPTEKEIRERITAAMEGVSMRAVIDLKTDDVVGYHLFKDGQLVLNYRDRTGPDFDGTDGVAAPGIWKPEFNGSPYQKRQQAGADMANAATIADARKDRVAQAQATADAIAARMPMNEARLAEAVADDESFLRWISIPAGLEPGADRDAMIKRMVDAYTEKHGKAPPAFDVSDETPESKGVPIYDRKDQLAADRNTAQRHAQSVKLADGEYFHATTPDATTPDDLEKTKYGRVIYRNAKGEAESELSVTVQNPSTGLWYNIPSLNWGKMTSRAETAALYGIPKMTNANDQVLDIETGEVIPGFTTESEAVEAAKARSRELSGELGGGQGVDDLGGGAGDDTLGTRTEVPPELVDMADGEFSHAIDPYLKNNPLAKLAMADIEKNGGVSNTLSTGPLGKKTGLRGTYDKATGKIKIAAGDLDVNRSDFHKFYAEMTPVTVAHELTHKGLHMLRQEGLLKGSAIERVLDAERSFSDHVRFINYVDVMNAYSQGHVDPTNEDHIRYLRTFYSKTEIATGLEAAGVNVNRKGDVAPSILGKSRYGESSDLQRAIKELGTVVKAAMKKKGFSDAEITAQLGKDKPSIISRMKRWFK